MVRQFGEVLLAIAIAPLVFRMDCAMPRVATESHSAPVNSALSHVAQAVQ